MRIGVSLPNVGLDHGKEMVLPVAEAAERLGFDSVWVAHHVMLPYERESKYPYQRSGTEVAMSPGMQWLDPLVTLSMCAAVTDRVRLGTSVLVLPYRNPRQPRGRGGRARRADEGRFVLGVGLRLDAGGVQALGIDPAERGARTDEHIEVLRTLWTAGPGQLRRPLHAASTASCSPPRRAPRAARRSGSGGNTDAGAAPRAAPGRRLARLRGLSRGHAGRATSGSRASGDEVGRDPAELELSVVRGLMPPGREEESFVPDRRMLGGSAAGRSWTSSGATAEHGVHDVVIQVSLLAPLVPEALEWVAAEVLPQLPALTPITGRSPADTARAARMTAYYVLGIAMVVLAVVLSAIGLTRENFPPSRGGRPGDHGRDRRCSC